MDRVNICLVGAGRAAEVHGDVYYFSIPGAIITAVFDADAEKAKILAEKYHINERFVFKKFEDALSYAVFDAVVITTPTFTHCQYTKLAASKKVHVFCEKPMAITEKDCSEMIDICIKENVILQIGFMRRFDAGFRQAKQIMESGEIGEPLIIKSNTRGPGLPGRWAFDIKNSNGNLAEVNSHDFDSIRWLSGSEYKKIYAVAKNSKSSEIREEYPLFYDNATVSATMKNDVFGLIDGVCPCDYGYDARCEVVGTMGVLFIGSIQEYTTVTCTRKKQLVSPQVLSWKKRFHDAYIAEDRHFVECIINGKEPEVTGEDGKRSVAAVVAANESIFKGVPVEL
ncbi:MAG: oxidoreductase [Actinobacteria bacterium]|nr:oxidoreductase [Actinomycetota bacterium]